MRKLLLTVLCFTLLLTQNAFAETNFGRYLFGLERPECVVYNSQKGLFYGIEKIDNFSSRVVGFNPSMPWHSARKEKAVFSDGVLGGGMAWNAQVYFEKEQIGYFVSADLLNPNLKEKIVKLDYKKLDKDPFTVYSIPGYSFTGPRFPGPDGDIYVAGSYGGKDNLKGENKLWRIHIPANGKPIVTAVADLPVAVYTSPLFFLDTQTNIAYIVAGDSSFPPNSKAFTTTIACELGSSIKKCYLTGDTLPDSTSTFYNKHSLAIYTSKNKAYWFRYTARHNLCGGLGV